MRHVRNPQMELGEIGIENIRINLKSRDDIPALLLGLQHLYSDEETRCRSSKPRRPPNSWHFSPPGEVISENGV